MPWTCCDAELHDDVPACPACGQTKQAWTLHAGSTRALVITKRRARLEARRGVGRAPLPAGASYESEPAEVCPVVSKARAAAWAAAGQEPPPAGLLIARLSPRANQEPLVTLSVERTSDDPLEVEAVGAGEPPHDVVFCCVYGPEETPELAGLRVVDVSDGSTYAPEVELEGLGRAVELPTEPLAAPTLELLEVEDISFFTGREVLLPGAWSHTDDVTGLAVVGGALNHARFHPELRLLVAGHTDARGSKASNRVLSADRARNVQLYLSGQREAWAEHCQAHFEVEDVQGVLKWIAYAHGWDTDPGGVDGKWGSKSKRARDAFRARYAVEFGRELEPGKQRAADWAAFFDLYDLELAERLKTDVSRLRALREGLRFTEPPTLACGEEWPTRNPGKNPESAAANRRVDLLFFAESELPDLSAEPLGAGVYREGAFERAYLSVDEALKDPADAPYAEEPLGKDCPVEPVHLTTDALSDAALQEAASSGSPFVG